MASRNPDLRASVMAAATAFQPSLASEIARAGEIGAMLAPRLRGGEMVGARLAAPATGADTGASAASVPAFAMMNTARANSAVFNTWNYLPTRPIPTNVLNHYGWAINRNEVSNFYNDAAQREFGANWGNAAIGQTTAINTMTPNGLAGWRGRGVTVAVIDSGIDARFANMQNPGQGFAYVHPEFVGRLDLRSRRTFADGTFDLNVMDDSSSHGTHVAGTIAANFDGVGMVGVAPGANIIALKAIGDNAGDPVAAMAYAASQQDVRVINGSYGPSARGGETTWVTGNLLPEWFAVRQALANGKVLVFATGNDFEKAPIQAQNPTGIPLFPFIRPINAFHGAYTDGGQNLDFSLTDRLPGFIVAVTNLDHNLRIGSSSNRCGVAAYWCISAPGGGGNSGNPEGILSTVVQGTGIGPGNGYAYQNGTSMASPHVAGVVAVLMEAYPNYTPRDIVRLMFATAEDLGERGVDRIYGHGLVRLDRALDAGPAIGNIGDSFVRNVTAGHTETWAAPISSDRELVVQGTRSGAHGVNNGDLVIAGVAEFRGGVQVSTGDLVVEGTLKAPRLTVGQGARLEGDGVVQSNVIVNGALKPGYGPGELYIGGNVTMNAGSEFQADIDGRANTGGPGSFSRLILFGAGNVFQAGGRFSASFRNQDVGADNTFTPRIGDRFQVVSAEDGARVEGRFARLDRNVDERGVDGLPGNTRLALIYQPTSIALAINPASFANLSAHGIALNRRQSGVGLALDAMQDPATGAISSQAANIFDRLGGLDVSVLPSALEQLSGSGHAAVLRSSFVSAQQFSGMIGQRMDSLRSGSSQLGNSLPFMAFTSEGGFGLSGQNNPLAFASGTHSTAASAAPTYSLWGKMFGQWSHLGSDGASPALRTSGGGAVIGADMVVAQGLTLGIAGSYARNRTTGGGLSGDATSYLGAFYGSYTAGGFEADVLAGLTRAEFRTTRTIDLGGLASTAASSSNGTGFIANAEAGYRFRFTSDIPFYAKPFVGMSHNGIGRSAFSETGSGALGLVFPSQRFGVTQSRIGITMGLTPHALNDVSIAPELSVAWGRDLHDTTLAYRAALGGQSMSLQAVAPGRDALLVRTQLSAAFSPNFRMFAGYSGEFRSNQTTHRIDGGLRMLW